MSYIYVDFQKKQFEEGYLDGVEAPASIVDSGIPEGSELVNVELIDDAVRFLFSHNDPGFIGGRSPEDAKEVFIDWREIEIPVK